jgi:hypothetical protein
VVPVLHFSQQEFLDRVYPPAVSSGKQTGSHFGDIVALVFVEEEETI